jgi:hypothetical protein
MIVLEKTRLLCVDDEEAEGKNGKGRELRIEGGKLEGGPRSVKCQYTDSSVT